MHFHSSNVAPRNTVLYLSFLLMIMETIVQPCKAQKLQGEKN